MLSSEVWHAAKPCFFSFATAEGFLSFPPVGLSTVQEFSLALSLAPPSCARDVSSSARGQARFGVGPHRGVSVARLCVGLLGCTFRMSLSPDVSEICLLLRMPSLEKCVRNIFCILKMPFYFRAFMKTKMAKAKCSPNTF